MWTIGIILKFFQTQTIKESRIPSVVIFSYYSYFTYGYISRLCSILKKWKLDLSLKVNLLIISILFYAFKINRLFKLEKYWHTQTGCQPFKNIFQWAKHCVNKYFLKADWRGWDGYSHAFGLKIHENILVDQHSWLEGWKQNWKKEVTTLL